MEKRRVHATVKLSWIINLLLIVFLGGLVSCVSPFKKRTNTEKMAGPGQENPELLERIIELNASKIGLSEQIILVTNTVIDSTGVSIQTFEKRDHQWIRKFPVVRGSIGHHGFSPQQEKREGDQKTPTGIFELGPVFGYAEQLPTKMEYLQATENDFWIDDPQSEDYNKWVTRETPPGVSHEEMKRKDDLYKMGIVVQYNTGDIVKGNGSAIFVHIERGPGSPTAGCVALPETNLYSIIQWLQPEKTPLIIMGTEAELERGAM